MHYMFDMVIPVFAGGLKLCVFFWHRTFLFIVETHERFDSVGAEAKPVQANKNGKKSDGAGATSFFTWFMVLALLGVWTSVAVVYFDLVDYQGVIGKFCALFELNDIVSQVWVWISYSVL